MPKAGKLKTLDAVLQDAVCRQCWWKSRGSSYRVPDGILVWLRHWWLRVYEDEKMPRPSSSKINEKCKVFKITKCDFSNKNVFIPHLKYYICEFSRKQLKIEHFAGKCNRKYWMVCKLQRKNGTNENHGNPLMSHKNVSLDVNQILWGI